MTSPKRRARIAWFIGGVVLVGIGLIIWKFERPLSAQYHVGELTKPDGDLELKIEKVFSFGPDAVPPMKEAIREAKDPRLLCLLFEVAGDLGKDGRKLAPVLLEFFEDETTVNYPYQIPAFNEAGDGVYFNPELKTVGEHARIAAGKVLSNLEPMEFNIHLMNSWESNALGALEKSNKWSIQQGLKKVGLLIKSPTPVLKDLEKRIRDLEIDQSP